MTTRERIEEVLLRTFSHDLEHDISEREARVAADALERAGLQITPQAGEAAPDVVPDEFAEWWLSNYGPGCVLSRPEWHLPKIWRAAARCIKRRPAPPRPAYVGVDLASGPDVTAIQHKDGSVEYRENIAPSPVPKCDGNHAAPACADPECWQRPSPVAPAWQPIETAPRDGTEVLLLFPDGCKHIGLWGIWRDSSYPAIWQNQYGDALVRPWTEYDKEPTHWQPLPSPPDSPGAGDL